MKLETIICQTVFVLFSVVAACEVHAEDAPKVLKRGGRPADTRWEEEDVRRYLNLPRLASMDGIIGHSMNDIAGRLNSAQELAGYQFVKDGNRPYNLNSNESPVLTFELHKEKLPNINVRIYDYQSWNVVCDKIFKYITDTVELWNNIPDYYVSEERGDTYTLIRKGSHKQQWGFALKKLYIIEVGVAQGQKNAKSEEEAAAYEMNKVIQKLIRTIEDGQ